MAQNKINKVFIIGGSAGSFDALLNLLPILQPLTSAIIIIVLHRRNAYDTALANVFAYHSHIVVREVEDKEQIVPGIIYVAPADYHLLVEKDYSMSLDVSEKVNYSRPSIDVSFETAAEAFGKKLTGILLSGANTDGTKGLEVIKRFGGKTIVQEPASAPSPFMPQYAINNNTADYIMTPEAIGLYINENKS